MLAADQQPCFSHPILTTWKAISDRSPSVAGVISEGTVWHQASALLWGGVHTAGTPRPVLGGVFSHRTMFKLLSVVKLFSDLHTL